MSYIPSPAELLRKEHMQHALEIQESLLRLAKSSGFSLSPVTPSEFELWQDRFGAAWEAKGWEISYEASELTLTPTPSE